MNKTLQKPCMTSRSDLVGNFKGNFSFPRIKPPPPVPSMFKRLAVIALISVYKMSHNTRPLMKYPEFH